MAELVRVNGQLYCGQCGEEAEAEIDIMHGTWIAAKEARPEYKGPPRPSGTVSCLGCAYVGQLIPYAVVTRMGVDVYHELRWAWIACIEGL